MPINQSFLNTAAGVAFKNADEIDTFFTRQNLHDFISWFNASVANKGSWGKKGNRAGISMANDSKAHERFDQLLSADGIKAIFGANSVSLLQFLSLQSIINNETGGTLLPGTERVGRPPLHPGIAYAFDKIPEIKKRSYNTLAGNKTCFQLFNDVNYNNAFQNLPLGNQLKNTTNNVWAGETYPLTISTSTNPTNTGYILEADFFKFRGRGFIQTTGRSNYIKIIEFIMNYQGTNTVINTIKTKWTQQSNSPDVIATISTNADWDELFQNTSLVPGKSIDIHNSLSGNYLGGIDGSTPAKATSTIRNIGKRISGGDEYANLYIARVTEIIELL